MRTTLLPTIPEPGTELVLENVSWDTYEAMRDTTDEAHQHVRISYDNGRMAIMSPLHEHEWIRRRIGRLIETATLEWGVPIASLGNSTWKRRDERKGLEADECYYIQNEASVRGRRSLDLKRDPPPDLAVEVNITSSSLGRQPIYATLGVNEIWRHDGKQTQFLKLGESGRYAAIERSEALPRLTPGDIDRFLEMFWKSDETTVLRAFRDWVRSI